MLHLAALTDQPRIIAALIKQGADVNAKVRGVTPLDAIVGVSPPKPSILDVVAIRQGYGLAAARVLRAHGAKGEHFEKLIRASADAEKSSAVQNMDFIIHGLGGG